MSKKFTKLMAALALLTFLAVPMGMRGQETVTATSTTMTARVSYQDLETGKLIEYKNSAGNSYSNPLRIYSGNTFTIHAKEGVEKITQIAIVANSTSYANATGSATWTATGEGSCSATASVSGSNVTVAITGKATTVTCKPSAQVRWNQLSVTYVTSGTPPAITYTMTYDANGGIGTMTDEDSPYDANATVTVLDNEFTREHFDFVKWNTKADGTGTDYDEGDTFTIRDNTTLYAQWESDGTAGEGSICFSNQSSCTAINGQSVTGEDDLGNTWTITTVGTSSFSANSGYYQVGSGNSPATSITFTTTLDEEVNVTDFSATFGGFNATRASVVLKVDDTQVGFGTLNGASDVTVSSSSAQIGTTLTVIVTPTAGGVKCYNISYAYETIDNPAVATTTTINVPQDFNTDIYQGTTAGTLTATVKDNENNTISDATVTWSSSNTGVATIDANGEVTLVAVGTTTITASYAGVEDQYRPSTCTYELTVVNEDPNAPGTQNNPYTVARARAAIDAGTGTQGVYATGIVSEIVTAYSEQYQNITFDIVDEAGNANFLRAYRCGGTQAADVQVGDIVVVSGNLTLYNSIYELAQGCELVSLIHPAVPSITVNPDEVNVDATPAAGEDFIEGTLDLTWENLEITDFLEDFAIQYYDAEGEELADDPNWIMVDLATQDPNIGEGYLVSYYMVENEGPDARTAYFKVYAMDDETNLVYSNLVTVTQAAPVAPATGDEYALYTGELVEGDYLIVYDGGAMNTTVESDRLQYVAVSATNNVIVTDNAAIVWHIAKSGEYWTIYNADANAYAASTGAKNKAQMLADGTDDKALWTVSGTETYEFVNKKNTANNVNANLRKNGTYGFACYATSTGGALSLYKKVVEPATETYELTINGYGSSTTGGWNLIASPVAVDPATVEGMVVANTDENYKYFDLYYFDQTGGQNGKEWKNYKANHFNLVPGKGYLYANAENVDLVFTGEMNNEFEDVYLPYDANDDIKSLYLAGNSKTMTETFFVYDGNLAKQTVNFLTLNDDGNGFITTSANSFTVDEMHGFFVQSGGENWTLSTADMDAKSGTPELLNVMVSQNRGALVDNAIVSFGNAPLMSKFYLSDNSTRVFIQQNGEEMAVVRTEAQGEMPVNFKANEDGQYTLTVNPEGVEMGYLHLIDNMTGADIDLLATPSYSFEAKTTDYESRFRLVFAANNEDGVSTGSTTFAFFSNGSWIINNEGEATLQVIDLNGRILSSETINGSVSTSLNATTGIYMMRLINGDNVKTQKVVVR